MHILATLILSCALIGFASASIVAVAQANGLTTLLAAAQAADLGGVLGDLSQDFTVFAPTNEAFEALPAGVLEDLLKPENKETLRSILLFHVVSGSSDSSTLLANGVATTVNGALVTIEENSDDAVLINGDSQVLIPNVQTDNGIVHVVNKVMIPLSPRNVVLVAEADPANFSTLLAAIDAAGLRSVLENVGSLFTVFAPTNAAFAKLPAGTLDTLLEPTNRDQLVRVLTYHVVSGIEEAADLLAAGSVEALNGETLTVTQDDQLDVFVNGDVKVTAANIGAANGRVHVIDTVLIPPPLPTIIEIAEANGYTTFLAAVDALELRATLSDPNSQLTAFVPTNAAFDALPEGALAALLLPENIEQLRDIVTYHVLAVNANSEYLLERQLVRALNEREFVVEADADGAIINKNVRIESADLAASNGFVHVISDVLMVPSNLPALAQEAGLTTLVAAVTAAELGATLDSNDVKYTVFAPSNEAFAALPAGTLDSLLLPENKEQLQSVLLYHTLAGSTAAVELLRNGEVLTMNGDVLTIAAVGDTVTINGDEATITATNIIAGNGIVHTIDKVLIPKVRPTFVEIAGANGLTTLATALAAADLIDVLSNEESLFTVFAPSNEAFDALPGGELERLLLPENKAELQAVLLYHVIDAEQTVKQLQDAGSANSVSGVELTFTSTDGTAFINDAEIVASNVRAVNGFANVINKVLLPPAPELSNLVELAEADPQFSTLVAAIDAAGLRETLSSASAVYTVFAPNNAAFAKLPAGTVESLLLPENTAQLVDILLYHVLSGSVNAAAVLATPQHVTLLDGNSLTASVQGEQAFINNAQILETDVMASNGLVHVIDSVLLPPAPEALNVVQLAEADPQFSTLVAAIDAAGVRDTLSNPDAQYTVFAPNNAAFAKLAANTVESLLLPENKAQLVDILLYHVLPGSVNAAAVLATPQHATLLTGNNVTASVQGAQAFINNAQILQTDLMASNGIVHVIDSVLLPAAPETSEEVVEGNLLEVARLNGFTTLLAAIEAADLSDVLSDETTELTVFAPTNEAFEKLAPGVLDGLLNDKAALTNVLTYHVVSGSRDASYLLGVGSVATLQGEEVTVTRDGEIVRVNGAQVAVANVGASNGIVHVIDTVLLPPAPSVDESSDLASTAANLEPVVDSEGTVVALVAVGACLCIATLAALGLLVMRSEPQKGARSGVAQYRSSQGGARMSSRRRYRNPV